MADIIGALKKIAPWMGAAVATALPGPIGAVAEQLIEDVGLCPMRLGDVDQVGLVDSVGSLWFALALGQGKGRHLAFKVLSR